MKEIHADKFANLPDHLAIGECVMIVGDELDSTKLINCGAVTGIGEKKDNWRITFDHGGSVGILKERSKRVIYILNVREAVAYKLTGQFSVNVGIEGDSG